MKKKLLVTLMALGLAGLAHAQTNVTIYGQVDAGIAKETGSDVSMAGNDDSWIGFEGTEDLGGGWKATFQLEKRFNLNDGTKFSDDNAQDTLQGSNAPDWHGAANVGISSETWGGIKLGRVNDIAIENFVDIDPFETTGVAGSFVQNNLIYAEQISNTIRYDSPEWAGFSFNATYTLGQDGHHQNGVTVDEKEFLYEDYGNDGFGLGLKYDNGDLLLMASYTRVADSDKSWLWNAGAAYTWKGLTVSAGYQATKIKRIAAYVLHDIDDDMEQKDWMIGLKYETGPHTIRFAYNRGEVESDTEYNGKANKYSLGYSYDLSKRTTLYANVAYTDSDNDAVGEIYNTSGVSHDSATGVSIGMVHTF